MESLKQLKVIYYSIISAFVVFSLIVILLKKQLGFQDIAGATSVITFITPLIMIVSILVAYGLYDYKARKAKKTDDNKIKEKLFVEATIIKLAFIEFAGLLSAFALLVYWRPDYLYILGIVLVFFLLAYPTQLRYDRDFAPTLE